MKFSKASGALPRTPLGGLQRPPDPQLEKGRAAHGLSCFARLTIVLLFTFFVLRPDQFLFRCYGLETVSIASVRKVAMTRRRASSATLSSQQNDERRVQSHRFSGRLAYGEGISERNPLPRLINIVVVRRQEDVGLLRTNRPPLTLSWSSGLRILS